MAARPGIEIRQPDRDYVASSAKATQQAALRFDPEMNSSPNSYIADRIEQHLAGPGYHVPLALKFGEWQKIVKALRGSNGPKSESLVSAWNESVQRGLKHEFFQDGLAADTYELQPWQAYAEGWRDAWLESADDLHNATQDGKP